MEKIQDFFSSLILKLGITGELFGFFWKNKRWWIIPIIVVILVISALLIFSQSTGIAPFIYPLF